MEWQSIIDESRSNGWLLSREQITLGTLLGEGAFGATYTGTYNGQMVAVKQLQMKSDTAMQLFIRELRSQQSVRSPNIVKLIGVVIEPPQICWLVSEYLSGGTLKIWIHGAPHHWKRPKHSLKENVSMCLQIAQGMQVLESMNPPIMHRDLKPSNILLDSLGQPKIADFGLSRSFEQGQQNNFTTETGSYLHMSPEMLKSEPYGPKTDVFSFATIMAEVFSQQTPYHGMSLTPIQAAIYMADKGGRPVLPSVSAKFPQPLKDLIEECWSTVPEQRPNFATIVQRLQSI